MTEHAPAPEAPLSPQEALFAYLAVGSGAEMGASSLEDLTSWQAAVRKARLKPDQQLHAGWISVEHSFRLVKDQYGGESVGSLDAEATQAAAASLTEAQEIFSGIIDKPGVNDKLKAQAIVARTSIPLYRSLLCGDSQAALSGFHDYYDAQFEAAGLSLRQWQRFNNLVDVPALHALSAMLLINQDPYNDRFALPAPARTMEAMTDAKDSWSFILWKTQGPSSIYQARVASTGPRKMICIPPAVLQNSDYPSKHGQGTLQALLDDYRTRRHEGALPRYAANFSPKQKPAESQAPLALGMQQQLASGIGPIKRFLGAADIHIDAASKTLQAEISLYLDGKAREMELPEGPIDLTMPYLDMPAHSHSSHFNTVGLDKLTSAFENLYEAGELDPSNKILLGWVHIESAIKAATEQQFSASLGGAFDRAEDLFAEAASDLADTDRHNLSHEARLAQLAAKVYKAVSLGEEGGIDVAEAHETYNVELAELGEQMLEDFYNLEDYTGQYAAEMNLNVHLVNILLAASTGTNGGHIAAVCTLRQRGITARNNNGWHVNIWPLSADGFKPDLHGKIRLAEHEDAASIDYDIVTIGGRRLNPDGDFEMLRSLISKARGGEADPRQKQQTEAATARITAAAEISDW